MYDAGSPRLYAASSIPSMRRLPSKDGIAADHLMVVRVWGETGAQQHLRVYDVDVLRCVCPDDRVHEEFAENAAADGQECNPTG